MAKTKPVTWAQTCLQVREAMRLSQEQFALTIGCTVRSVSRWENGTTEPISFIRRHLTVLAKGRRIKVPE